MTDNQRICFSCLIGLCPNFKQRRFNPHAPQKICSEVLTIHLTRFFVNDCLSEPLTTPKDTGFYVRWKINMPPFFSFLPDEIIVADTNDPSKRCELPVPYSPDSLIRIHNTTVQCACAHPIRNQCKTKISEQSAETTSSKL